MNTQPHNAGRGTNSSNVWGSPPKSKEDFEQATPEMLKNTIRETELTLNLYQYKDTPGKENACT